VRKPGYAHGKHAAAAQRAGCTLTVTSLEEGEGHSARIIMDMKRLFRGPIVYIVLAVVAVWIGSSLLTGSGFREVTTQEGLDYLKSDAVSSAKIVDGEQRVDLTLAKADGENVLLRCPPWNGGC
jgi:hypothetical protein